MNAGGAASHRRLKSGEAREDTGSSGRPRAGGRDTARAGAPAAVGETSGGAGERAGCGGESAAAAARQVSCFPSQKRASKFGELSVFFLNNPI